MVTKRLVDGRRRGGWLINSAHLIYKVSFQFCLARDSFVFNSFWKQVSLPSSTLHLIYCPVHFPLASVTGKPLYNNNTWVFSQIELCESPSLFSRELMHVFLYVTSDTEKKKRTLLRAVDKARTMYSQVRQVNLTAVHKELFGKWHKSKYHLKVYREGGNKYMIKYINKCFKWSLTDIN